MEEEDVEREGPLCGVPSPYLVHECSTTLPKFLKACEMRWTLKKKKKTENFHTQRINSKARTNHSNVIY